MSESTTALNVDQTNSSVLDAEVKPAPSGAALPLQSPLGLAATATRGNNQEQAAVATETDVNNSIATTVVSAASTAQKKDGGVTKPLADKKKMDARKKSLKRL